MTTIVVRLGLLTGRHDQMVKMHFQNFTIPIVRWSKHFHFDHSQNPRVSVVMVDFLTIGRIPRFHSN